MKTLIKATLPKLKPPQSEVIKLKPLPFRQLLSPDSSRQLPLKWKLLGGLASSGLVLTCLSAFSLSSWSRISNPALLDSFLWKTTGPVRQSLVNLEQAQRFLLQPSSPNLSPDSPVGQTPQATDGDGSDQASRLSGQSSLSQPGASQAGHVVNQPPIASRGSQAKAIDTLLEMRVALTAPTASLEIASSTNSHLTDLNGQTYCNLKAQSSFVVSSNRGGMVMDNCQLSNSAWIEPGRGGYVYVNDRWYRGRVLIMASDRGLTAINFVLLGDYLSSVVGSEMYAHWPLEALKAQAVAARSYALVHHVRNASRPYDLDNTQRYQAYLGIAKETNTTQAAVVATTGEFISYRGGIVESLYAASDTIVDAVHNGNGMSQSGAMDLATRGYRYTDILGNYYPGTSLSRLVVH
ncbi:MAG: SpoIID/LytB domain-containing protein [Cyanobacteria bacterium REEB459]|nr:SpoIID/LytB domain-containing protein [Cyanobacteria bacterium REEB459]